MLDYSRIIEGHYETDKTEFYNSNYRYGCFSNFSAHRVVFDQISWPTAEHCYQAQKFTDRVLWANILNQSTAKEAARLGRENGDHLRRDWNSIKISKMYEIVKAKIIQNPDVYLTLISTGDSSIVETSPTDSFWGVGPNGKGKNHLGKIIESIREDIR
ncbi:MAG: NADAR family protein [Rubrivivax sp.]|nr:NADAR family protein [Rubrivivax sp.]